MQTGTYNLCILAPSLFLTNKHFYEVDPLMFNFKSTILILLWGLLTISVAWDYASVPYLFLVLAVEKLVYVIHWIQWIKKRPEWIDKVNNDINLAPFFHLYGVGDLFFGSAFVAIGVLGIIDQSKL